MNDKNTLYARMLSGELTQEEIQKLKASGEWQEIEQITNFMDRVEMPPLDKKAVLSKIKARQTSPKSKRMVLSPMWKVAVAASVLIVLGIFTYQNYATKAVSAEYASTKRYKLPDQTEVILNDGSTIKFKKKGWQNNRVLTLEGEAFFDVTKGAPFKIKTKNGDVQVLGTSFNVRSWGESLVVECYTGKVQVSNNHQELVLTSGSTARLNDNEGTKEAHPHQTSTWLNNVSVFDAEDINAVFSEIERQFDVDIKAPDLDKNFTGRFHHHSLEEALLEVCSPMGLQFTIDDKSEHVIIF